MATTFDEETLCPPQPADLSNWKQRFLHCLDLFKRCNITGGGDELDEQVRLVNAQQTRFKDAVDKFLDLAVSCHNFVDEIIVVTSRMNGRATGDVQKDLRRLALSADGAHKKAASLQTEFTDIYNALVEIKERVESITKGLVEKYGRDKRKIRNKKVVGTLAIAATFLVMVGLLVVATVGIAHGSGMAAVALGGIGVLLGIKNKKKSSGSGNSLHCDVKTTFTKPLQWGFEKWRSAKVLEKEAAKHKDAIAKSVEMHLNLDMLSQQVQCFANFWRAWTERLQEIQEQLSSWQHHLVVVNPSVIENVNAKWEKARTEIYDACHDVDVWVPGSSSDHNSSP